MKKLVSLFLCAILVLSAGTPVSASEPSDTVHCRVAEPGNGITVTQEIIELPMTRSTDKAYLHKSTFSNNGDTIAVIAFTVTYRYNGSTVSVVSKAVTQTDTYNGWSYTQQSFTSSGGSVTLTGKLSKWWIFNHAFSMTMTCDKNGNISYS